MTGITNPQQNIHTQPPKLQHANTIKIPNDDSLKFVDSSSIPSPIKKIISSIREGGASRSGVNEIAIRAKAQINSGTGAVMGYNP